VPPYRIDCHQPTCHASSKAKSPCHIPTVVSVITDEWSLRTRRDVLQLPCCTRPHLLNYCFQTGSISASNLARSQRPSVFCYSLDYSLQLHIPTRFIQATKCLSKLAPARPPIASPNSLDHSLQVELQACPIMASMFAQLRPPCAPPGSVVHGL
jgi:hypothetical protein